MGYKKLSESEERQLVEEYRNGTPVKELMSRYGYKTKKSITDKVKKYYPEEYQAIVSQAHTNRREYNYSLEKIASPFDAYLVGLMLTDGYVLSDKDGVGLDMTDKDVIEFVAKSIGGHYKEYPEKNKKTRYRILIIQKGITEQIARFGVIKNKSYIIPKPQLLPEEEIYLPYIIRGIIDGDGCISPTTYGGSQFYIVTMSQEFAEWIVDILTTKFYMEDIHIRQREDGIFRIETANQYNILKLIALVYNKPFGMMRKYNQLRKTFRDYNKDFLEDGIVQTPTE